MKRLLTWFCALGWAACAPQAPTADAPTPSATAANALVAPVAAAPSRLGAIAEAEHRRRPNDITDDDRASRDVATRRAAIRALARIGGDAARPGLLRALADEDDEVVSWAAYGLGFTCKGHEAETASALVAAALPRIVAAQTNSSGRFDAFEALARALGKCGAETSEPTLVGWLRAPRSRAVAAAVALGDYAVAKKKLREETLAALLSVAAGSAAEPPIPEALFAPGRLDHVPPSVLERLREVASARLAEPGPARLFAVRALGRSGPEAAEGLAKVVGSKDFTMPERTEAARALPRLEKAGQNALAEVLPTLLPAAPLSEEALLHEDTHVLVATLDGFTSAGKAARTLEQIAKLSLPEGASLAAKRRLSWIRCGAAKVLAGKSVSNPLLLACDVAQEAESRKDALDEKVSATLVKGTVGQRAMVAVLGRAPIEGARLTAFQAYARYGELRAREDALALLEEHDEVEGVAALLAEALRSKHVGIVGSAADVIAKKPQIVRDKPKKGRKKKPKEGDTVAVAPSPEVVKALVEAIGNPALMDDPEQAGSLIEAAGALGLAEVKAPLEAACRSSFPTLREHAQKALELVTGKKITCDAPAEGGDLPSELARALPTGPVTITFTSELGPLTLTLDPTVAPQATSRIVELVRSGYYEGNVVHRVVPGFVTQLGAPDGDGWGGPPMPPLRCETSPLAFEVGTVGVALAGRDTGSSQIFVMHGRYPHLDGGYAWIGTATGPWSALIDGDHVREGRVSVKEGP